MANLRIFCPACGKEKVKGEWNNEQTPKAEQGFSTSHYCPDCSAKFRAQYRPVPVPPRSQGVIAENGTWLGGTEETEGGN